MRHPGRAVTSLEICARAIQAHGFHVIRDNGTSWWVPARSWRTILKALELHGDGSTITMVPRMDIGSHRLTVAESPVLWVKTESRDACKRLARFKPEPTIVLREGDTVRQVALWSLTTGCPVDKLERANGRLSYRVGAKKLHGVPGFEFFPPGAVVKLKRKEIPVVAAGGSGEPVPAGQLLNGLRDRPDPPDWRAA